MKKFTVTADIVFQAYYEIECENEYAAKAMVEQEEGVEPFELAQATSPMVVSVEEINASN